MLIRCNNLENLYTDSLQYYREVANKEIDCKLKEEVLENLYVNVQTEIISIVREYCRDIQDGHMPGLSPIILTMEIDQFNFLPYSYRKPIFAMIMKVI